MQPFIVNLDNDEVKFQYLRSRLHPVCKKSICHPDNLTNRMQPNKFIFVSENGEDCTYIHRLSYADTKLFVPFQHALRMIDKFVNR